MIAKVNYSNKNNNYILKMNLPFKERIYALKLIA